MPRINITNPQGETISIEDTELEQAKLEGWDIESHQQKLERLTKAEVQEDSYSGVKALGEGIVRGVVPFGQDIMEGLGVDETASRARQDEHSTASAIGEYGAMVATILSPKTVLKGLSAPGLIMKAEKGVEKLATKGIEKLVTKGAEKGLSKGAQSILKAVPTVAGSAVGGALYGTKEYLDETQIGRVDFLGDSLVSNAGMGAAIGGIFGVGSKLIGGITKKFGSKIDDIKQKIPKAAEKQLEKEYIHELGLTKAQVKNLRDHPAKKKKLFEELRQIFKQADDKTPEGLEIAATKLKKQVGKGIGSKYSLVDDQIVNHIDEVDKIHKNLMSDLKAHFNKKYGPGMSSYDEGILKTLQKDVYDPLELKMINIIDSDLAKQPYKSTWDSILDWQSKMKPYGNQEIFKNMNLSTAKQVAREANEVARRSLRQSMGQVDDVLKNEVEVLNARYGPLIDNEEFLKKAVAKELSSKETNFVSRLASMLTLGTELASGTGGIKSGLKAAGVYAGSKALKAITNSTKLHNGKILLLEHAAKGTLKEIDGGVIKFFKSGSSKSKGLLKNIKKTSPAAKSMIIERLNSFTGEKAKTKKQAFKQITNKLVELKNPEKQAELVANNISELSDFAPQTAGVVAERMVNSINFLHDKMPMNPGEMSLFKNIWEPSDFQMIKFSKYVEAVDHPLQVIKDLSNGTLNYEGIEVLEEIYPEMYQFLVTKYTVALEDKTLPYSKKLLLSNFLKIPLMDTESALILQEDYTQEAQEQQVASTGDLKIEDQESTQIQRVMARS